MRLTRMRIKNFRAHRDTEISLSQFGCLIGENNAGKSSVLHALQFVLEDRKLTNEDFQDQSIPISVELRIEGITDEDLKAVGETHRDRVLDMIRDHTLTIIRIQEFDGKAESKYLKLIPKDPAWSEDRLLSATKGKRGAALREAVVELLPDLDKILPSAPTQQQVRAAWEELVKNLPETDKEEEPASYPTGISQAVKPLLPSVIYIEAVKDASTEAKSTGSAAFSKLLDLLFNEVSDQFNDIKEQFHAVHQKLSRILDTNGIEIDNRLEAVKRIESVIESFIRTSFPGVSVRMEVPAPTLSMLLSSAELLVDDGHMGAISGKGDGLKRTVLFALLRAYASMRSTGIKDTTPTATRSSYILLFEEPELYLHPRAQRQLMAALKAFSDDHQVLVTTHSPGFFRPDANIDGFTRLQKEEDGISARFISLPRKDAKSSKSNDIDARDAYQIVQYENNEAAFFAHRVVLVEGDSDTYTYPHLAKIINKRWDHLEKNIMFIKIGGKGNIKRYKNFFSRFKVPIHVITDLDALINGFEQLTDNEEIKSKRSKLMQLVGSSISSSNSPNSKKLDKVIERRPTRELWEEAQKHFENLEKEYQIETLKHLEKTLTELFNKGKDSAKIDALKSTSSEEIPSALEEVISSLAQENVYVLKQGDLESYCQTGAKSNKVTTAISFCENITNIQLFRALHNSDADNIIKELEGIFSKIYD